MWGCSTSLLEPTSPLAWIAQQLASKSLWPAAHVLRHQRNVDGWLKIVTQALVAPGDIVLLDRNCHQSRTRYGMMMAGEQMSFTWKRIR